MKAIIVQASARSKGNTHFIVKTLQKEFNCPVIDLKQYTIHGYSYEHEHLNDDFLSIIQQLVNYDLLIFATPVYWYSMSGLLKNFFDRFTDLLKVEKQLGHQLKGKKMAAVACGSDNSEVESFFIPFAKTAAYLGMEYLSDVHNWLEEDGLSNAASKQLHLFINQIVTN